MPAGRDEQGWESAGPPWWASYTGPSTPGNKIGRARILALRDRLPHWGHGRRQRQGCPPGGICTSRAVIAGQWARTGASFLQGLVTAGCRTLAPGGLRFAGLLNPQGRLLHDLFLVGRRRRLARSTVRPPLRDALDAAPDDVPLARQVEIVRLTTPVAGALERGGAACRAGGASTRACPSLGFRGHGRARRPGRLNCGDESRPTRRTASPWRIPGPADFEVGAPYLDRGGLRPWAASISPRAALSARKPPLA